MLIVELLFMAQDVLPSCVQSFLHYWESACVSLNLFADGRISIANAPPHYGWMYDDLGDCLFLLIPTDDIARTAHMHRYDRLSQTNVWRLQSVNGRLALESALLFPKESVLCEAHPKMPFVVAKPKYSSKRTVNSVQGIPTAAAKVRRRVVLT